MAEPNPFARFVEKPPEVNPFAQFVEPAEFTHPRAANAEALYTVVQSLVLEIMAGLGGAVVAGPAGMDAAADAVGGIRDKRHQPSNAGAQAVVGQIGKAGEAVTLAARAPVAGLAGLFTLPRGLDEAADVTRTIMREGVGPTAGRAVADLTGSPALATAAHTLPTGLATLFGIRARAPKPDMKPGPVNPRISAEPIRRNAAAEDIARGLGKKKNVAGEVQPDMEIIEAAERLGVDLNPEHYSTNAAFREVTRALKSQPGSKLEAAERKALGDLSERADSLVDEIGGSVDKASVNAAVVTEFDDTIRAMETKADELYGIVDDAIPNQTRVNPETTREFIANKLDDLGGDEKLLTSAEKQLRDITIKIEDGEVLEVMPTYAALDRVRKNVGAALNKRSGPFKDDETGTLKRIYSVLSEDQQRVSELFGVADTYTAARSVVAKRKAIEDQAVTLFGRKLSDSMVPKMKTAATGLTKGDVSRFEKLMDALPEARRPEVAATILDDLFASGSRRGGQLSGGFVSAFKALNRNKAAKDALFEHLPEGARQRFDDIGKVLTGIMRANEKPLSNPSGSALPIIAAIGNSTFLGKVYGVTKTVAAEGVTTVVGSPGLGTVTRILLAKGKKPSIQAADELLASDKFRTAIGQAINGDTAAAERTLSSSRRFKAWLTTVPPGTAQRITAVGFIAWLTSGEDDQ